MIEPSLLALFAPGAGTQRKPKMTLTGNSALLFDQVVQRSPSGSKDTAVPGNSEVTIPLLSAPSNIALPGNRLGGFAFPTAELPAFESGSAQVSPGTGLGKSSLMHYSHVELMAVSTSTSTFSQSDLTGAVPRKQAPAAPSDLQGPAAEHATAVLPEATPSMVDLVSRAASESADHLLGRTGVMDGPPSAITRLPTEASVPPIVGAMAMPSESAGARPAGVAVPAGALLLPEASPTPARPAEGSAGRPQEEAGRPTSAPQETSIGHRKASKPQVTMSVSAPDIGPPRSAQGVIDSPIPATPEPGRAPDTPSPQASHPHGLSVAQSTPAATPLAESSAPRAEAPASTDSTKVESSPGAQTAVTETRNGPPILPIAPVPAGLADGAAAPRPAELQMVPTQRPDADDLPRTQQANAAPVVMSRFRPTAEMVNKPAFGAKETNVDLPSDRPQSSEARSKAAAQTAANRPTSGDLTLASTTLPTTPTPTQSDAPLPLADAVIDLATVEAQRPVQSATEIARAVPYLAEHSPRVIETIANAARALADRPIELVLNPEELGRLKMTLLSSENGMVVQLTVERPETLELLRRHIDLLASDLRLAGYERLSFGFSGDQTAGGRSQQGDSPATAAEKEPADLAESAQIPLSVDLTLSGDGLDLRL